MTQSQICRTFDDRAKKTIAYLKEEFSSIRTGVAQGSLVNNLSVEAYNSKMKLKELASITIPDPKTIAIEPWDKQLIKDIEKAIQISDIGLTPNFDGRIIRLTVPDLNEERRKELSKLIHDRVEEAHVSLRNIREECVKNIREQEDDTIISEDEAARERSSLEELMKSMNKQIDELGSKKEQEIMTV